MAKKEQTSKTNVLDLVNTLVVENQTYNVNAVHSETSDYATDAGHSATSDIAGCVEHSLNIREQIKEDELIDSTFNGSEERTIHYVPATGGTFTGPVTIKNNDSELDSDSIINLGQMEDKIRDLTGFPVYLWDGEKLEACRDTNDNFAKLNIILGTKDNYDKLLEYVASESGAGEEPFIYIFLDSGIDSGTMYLKLNGHEPIKLANTAEYLIDKDGNQMSFDNLLINIKGLADSINDILEQISGIVGEFNKHKEDIASGAEVVRNAKFAEEAEKAELANEAVEAVADDTGATIKTNYYRCQLNTKEVNSIWIGTSAPQATVGNNGDIYIVYSA